MTNFVLNVFGLFSVASLMQISSECVIQSIQRNRVKDKREHEINLIRRGEIEISVEFIGIARGKQTKSALSHAVTVEKQRNNCNFQ